MSFAPRIATITDTETVNPSPMPAPRLVSGIKPTGDIHIGNYFAVIKQLVELQDAHESFVFIADLHALNQIHDKELLSRLIREVATAYLAAGLDPEKAVLFRQSDVPAHSELCWILNCITSLGALERAHAYKDAVAKGRPINVGLFDYPVLMAADILLYQPDIVPVGRDQQQHVEITVDLAQRFNHLFGQTFAIPQALVQSEAAIVPGVDGQKMSKSYNNVIGLFETPEATTKKVMSIKTDSKGPSEPKDPDTCSIFALHRLVSQPQLADLEKRYREGSISYKESKDILAQNMNDYLAPMRAKKAEYDAQPEKIDMILAAGKERAQAEAARTLAAVKANVGL